MKKPDPPFVILLLLLLHALPLLANNNPGFRQQADHIIRATLDDESHLLSAHITTTYHNNSPDTLYHIYIHLWPNAYSTGSTSLARELLQTGRPDLYFAPEYKRGFIDSLDLRINNKPAIWGFDPHHVDIAILYLEEPLLPGKKLQWSTPFRMKFPDSRFSRLGHNDQAYFATQWYPKPAVYDHKGWHPMPYLSFAEFYSEFGDVDLFLTLPANYVVGSSGEVVDWSERLWMEGLARETANADPGDLPDRREIPPSDKKLKTIHLAQKQVHDFAWVADKRFYISRSSVYLPSENARKQVETWAFFYEDAEKWLKATAWINDALYFFSSHTGVYPYPSMSAAMVRNSAGANMEYPAFTIIGPANSDFALERVLVHETAHNWFYGILASNEREFPWMDEGLAQYYEMKYLNAKYPSYRLPGRLADTWVAEYFGLDNIRYQDYYYLWYLYNARRNLDQPIELPAPQYTLDNYFSIVYYKAALAFNYLENYLGTSVFENAMREYYSEWKFRHPYPDDLREVFERVYGNDLSWFFEDLLQTTGKIDYRVKKLIEGKVQGEDPWILTVKNNGDLLVPFPVSGIKNDTIAFTLWYHGFFGEKDIKLPAGDFDAFKIDAHGVVPEIFRHRNKIRTTGLFPGKRPLALQPLFSVEDPDVVQVFFGPVLGWNLYNGFMPGLAFYNPPFPYRPLHWLIMPMYGTRNDGFGGIARIEHSFFPSSNTIHSLNMGIDARRFAFSAQPADWHFTRLQGSAWVNLQKPYARSPVERKISIRNVWIFRDSFFGEHQQAVSARINYYVNEIKYSHNERTTLNPWSASLVFQQGKGFARLSGESRIFRHYPGHLKGMEFRFFAGSFLKKAEHTDTDFRFRLGGLRGTHDFLFDHTFFGRTQAPGTFAGNQITESEGGFKYPTIVGQTWDWLAAVNIKADIPKIPAKLYFDLGTYSGAATAFQGSQMIPWVFGVQILPVGNILEINFPVAASSDITQVATHSIEDYLGKITFAFYLKRLDPFRIMRNMRL